MVRMRPAVVSIAVALGLTFVPAAGAVTAGYDLFVTDPDTTSFDFSGSPVPADFFSPGSEPFTGAVGFCGEPIGSFQGTDTGDADTIVQRPNAANLPAPGSVDTVPIELVQLNLVSCQPIQVQVGTATESWDVEVDLSQVRSSQGQMTIQKTSEGGGTFSSELQVFPLFTFTRVQDGTQRTLDVGAQQLSDQAIQTLTLRAQDVPWSTGECPLSTPELSQGFCPGYTPDEGKQLTVEQALLAQHGIYPAQPRQNHYKCYTVRRQGSSGRAVRLVSQLGTVQAKLARPAWVCNPVKKNAERIENALAHLACYDLTGVQETPADTKQFVVRNQFGSAELTAGAPKRFCLPARKQVVRKKGEPPLGSGTAALAALGDHLACYATSGSAVGKTVRLTDQFHVERVRVGKPRYLCAPAEKNGERIQHPLQHLVCYAITNLGGRPLSPLDVRVRHQFGIVRLGILAADTLCVPTQKARKGGGGGEPPGITVTCDPQSVSIPAAGGTASTTCRLTSTGDLSGPVTVTCACPPGVWCTPSPGQVTLTADSFFDVFFEIQVPAATQPGTGTITVRATSGEVSGSASVPVELTGSSQPLY